MVMGQGRYVAAATVRTVRVPPDVPGAGAAHVHRLGAAVASAVRQQRGRQHAALRLQQLRWQEKESEDSVNVLSDTDEPRTAWSPSGLPQTTVRQYY